MDFLDSLLNGQRNKRDQYQRDMMQGFTDSRVTAMSPESMSFTVPDTRVSSMLARQAVRGSTGMDAPSSMNLVRSVPIAFGEKNNDTFKRLTAAGIKQGSTMFDVMEALQPADQGKTKRSPNNNTLAPSSAGQSRNPGTSLFPLTGNGYALNNGQAGPTDNYQAGYLSQKPDSLNDLQLDTFIQEQHQNFQRLLHSALFSDY